MTSPDPASGGNPETGGVSRYFTRVRTLWRRNPSQRGSILDRVPAPSIAVDTTLPSSPPVFTRPPSTEHGQRNGATRSTNVRASLDRSPDASRKGSSYSTNRHDRSRAIFAKYGLELPESEWPMPAQEPAERIERPVRMRVRFVCHLCQTKYGADRKCPKCNHRRCQQCSRYPPRKEHPGRSQSVTNNQIVSQDPDSVVVRLHAEPTDPVESQTTPNSPRKRLPWISIPSRTGGPELVRQPIMQRIYRTCHVCETGFLPGKQECPSCQHPLCVRCPREPPEPHKYPAGYPGDSIIPDMAQIDRVPRKTRMRVRYLCHECGRKLRHKHDICQDCGHVRCELCPKDSVRRLVPPPPDQANEATADGELHSPGLTAYAAKRTTGTDQEPPDAAGYAADTENVIPTVHDMARTSTR